jgi:magnesium chelatase family protein
MLTKIYSASVQGIDAFTVTIETVVERGVQFTIVGLPDATVRESYQRIVAAMHESGVRFPHKRIVINLAPADVKKGGSGFDLPMALGILASNEAIPHDHLKEYMVVGELSLDGSVLPARGILPMAIKAREEGFKKMIVPIANVTEAAIVNNVEVYGVESLRQAVDVIMETGTVSPTVINTREEFRKAQETFDFDFSEVKGQESVKRAFEVACAGGHNILLIGSPGSGKSMMSKRLPSILPPLTMQEALETTKIHSVAGTMKRGAMLMTQRPFRSPHHTVSPIALVGGGANPHPGEISLAHNGILFLDEFPEFPRAVLEVLRQPMEDRVISVTRATYSVDYPASFMLVASMNPCPCGYFGHPTRQCTCSPFQVQRYMSRVSGPLLDRIDLQIETQPVEIEAMADRTPGESSASIRARVIKAREIQTERYRDEPNVHCNAQMNSRLLHQYAWPDAAGMAKLKERMAKLNMSARAFDRILRVARTIADLEGVEEIQSRHIAEAIGYRSLDRGPQVSGLSFNLPPFNDEESK